MDIEQLKIKPIIAIIYYDKHGRTRYKRIETKTNNELEDLYKYFNQLSYDFLQWVKKYNEITIFRGAFRATYIKFLKYHILFVSRFENTSYEIRPIIKEYIQNLGSIIFQAKMSNKYTKFILETFPNLSKETKLDLKESLENLFERLSIETPKEIKNYRTGVASTSQKIDEQIPNSSKERIKEYEESKPFELVPKIEQNKMTEEIIEAANKKAIISLLFSSIKRCIAPSAAAYLFPKERGMMGELYAGDLEEKKILYVLESISNHPAAIKEMLASKEDLKILDADIVQIIVEDCEEGRLLIGITQNKEDVYRIGYKLKIAKHVIQAIGL